MMFLTKMMKIHIYHGNGDNCWRMFGGKGIFPPILEKNVNK